MSKLFLLSGAPIALPALLDYSSKQPYTHAVGSYNRSVNLLGFLYAAQIVHAFFLAGTPVARAPSAGLVSSGMASDQVVSFSLVLHLE